MADWAGIKTEYISTGISQRALAEKHGVSYSALRRHSEGEGWVALRQRQQQEIGAQAAQRSAEKISDALSDAAALRARLGVKLLRLVERAADQVAAEEALDPAALRRVVSSYRDMGGLPLEEGSGPQGANNLLERLAQVADDGV